MEENPPEEISAEADALSSALAEFQKHVHERISDFKQRLNTFAPIHRLPVEILSRVFELVCQSTPVDGLPGRLAEISIISRGLRGIVLQNASCWSTLSILHPPAFISQCLKQSSNTALTLVANASGLQNDLNSIATFAARFRTLDIMFRHESELAVLDLWSCAAPMLESLSLQRNLLRSYSSRLVATPFLNHPMPKLRELRLTGLAPSWDMLKLSGMQRLELEFCAGTGSPPVDHLLHTLDASPALKHLRLVGLSTEAPLQSMGTIHLPSLAFVHLQDLRPSLTAYLLANLRTDSCTAFHLTCNMLQDTNASASIRSSLSREGSLAFLAAADIVDTRIRIHGYHPHIELRAAPTPQGLVQMAPDQTPQAGLGLDLTSEALLAEITWVVGQYPASIGTRPLHLDLRGVRHLQADELVRLLETTPNLVRLDIALLGNTTRLLKWLGEPRFQDGRTRWMLPKLSWLSSEDLNVDAIDVLIMVDFRYGNRGGPNEDPELRNAELPSPFEVFDLGDTRLTREDAEALCGIIGDDAVLWDEPTDEEDDTD